MNKLVKYIIESRFNFNIDQLDIEDNEGDFSLSKQQYKSESMKQEFLELNQFVDLGLPSGTKWCKYNLGCDFTLLSSNPESTSFRDWYGKYYAWGEIKDKWGYNWNAYEHASQYKYKFTKYCTDPYYGYNRFADNLSKLLPEDDVAYQTNSNWRMPTEEQCQELIDHTDSKWISGKENDLYMNVKGLAGRLFTSKVNRNQIFIPAAGYKYLSSSDISYDGINCLLWSSSLDANYPNNAYYLDFSQSRIYMDRIDRFDGLSIRAVC